MSPRSSIVAVLLLCAFAGGACTTLKKEPPLPPPPPPGTPLTPEPQEPADEEPLPVTLVQEPIVVAAWAEPKRAADRGRSGPDPGADPEARRRAASRASRCACAARRGALFSSGKVLVTDGSGMTRDRLTTQADHRPSRSTPAARATASRCPSETLRAVSGAALRPPDPATLRDLERDPVAAARAVAARSTGWAAPSTRRSTG